MSQLYFITNRKGNASADILNTIVQWRDSETNYFCVMPDKLYDENGTIAFREEDSILAKAKAKQNYQIDIYKLQENLIKCSKKKILKKKL